MTSDDRGRITPMWLADHYPEDYDRCVRVGRSHVCRRCVVLYPLAFVVLGVAVTTGIGAGILGVGFVVLPLPSVVELLLEKFGILRYRPRRQIAVTVPLGIGLGCGFALYLADQTAVLFWGIVIAYTGVCVAGIALAHRRAVAEEQAELDR